MKKSLKLISALLAAMMSMTILTSTASANPQKNSQNTQSLQSNSVIKISSLEDLNHLRDLSNQGENFEGKTIILENDIYITKDGTKDGEPVEFKSIFKCPNFAEDNDDNGFKGTFDGNGKTLHFNSTNSNIFGSIGKGGIVKNLNITGRFEGNLDGGIVAMFNRGTIDAVNMNIIAKCDDASVLGVCNQNDKSGVIKNCSIKGEFSTNDMDCSGICGINDGTIESCKVSGKFTNCVKLLNKEYSSFLLPETSAVASLNTGCIKNCQVEAKLINIYKGKFRGCAGGIVSTNKGLIENSTFKGTVSAEISGKIAGSNHGIVKLCN